MPMINKKPLPVVVAPAVKARIEADSLEQQTSINNVVIKILAGHYGIAFEGTGRGHRGGTGSTQMNLPLPVRIYGRIDRDSLAQRNGAKRTKNEIVERIICSHYGIEYDERHNPVAA